MNLSSSKINIPNLGKNLVRRPRIKAVLNDALEYQAVYLSAPAGYGKTTELATWIAQSGIPFAWITLDEQSNNIQDFLKYLRFSIISVKKEADSVLKDLSQSDSGFDALLAGIQEITQPLVIIFDDFHLIKNETIINEIVRLIKYKPADISLIISGRDGMSNQFEKLVLEQKVKYINQMHLAFTQKEVAMFLEQADIVYTKEETARLYQATEGWPMAVVGLSAGKSIGLIPTVNPGNLLDEYIKREVWERQSEREKQFLSTTSILEKFTLEEAKAVSGCEDSEAMLEALIKKPIFIYADGNGWYRYHQYFSDFISTQIIGPEERKKAHARAAKFFENIQVYDKALVHFRKSQDEQGLVEFIDRNPDKVLRVCEPSEVIELIESLAGNDALQRMNVCICYGWALQYVRKPKQAEAFIATIKRRLDEQAKGLSKDRIKQIKLEIAAMSFPFAVAMKDEDKTLACLKRLYLSKVNKPIVFKSGLMESLYGCEYTLRDTAFGFYGRHNFLSGLVIKAEHSLLRPLLSQIIAQPSMRVALSETYYEQNKTQQAMKNLTLGIAESQKSGNIKAYLPAMLCLANIQRANGNVEESFETIKTCRLYLESSSAVLASRTLDAYQVRYDVVMGHARLVKNWKRDLLYNAHDDVSNISRAALYQYLSLVYVLIKENKFAIARLLIDRLLMMLEKLPDLVYKAQALFLDALLSLEEKDNSIAIKKTKRFLGIALDDGYYRTFVDFGQDCARLISLSLERSEANLTREEIIHAEHMLASANELARTMVLAKECFVMKSHLDITQREKEILTLLSEKKTNQQIADELYLSVQTVKNHIRSIYKKLGVDNRNEVINEAKRVALI